MAIPESDRKLREVDELAGEVGFWWGKTFSLIRKARVKTWKGVAILAFIAGAAAAVIWLISAGA